MVRQIDSIDELQRTLAGDAPVVVDCLAAWCKACKKMLPEVEAISRERAGVSFVKVDVDELESVAEEHAVVQMPTFLLFIGGKLVGRHEGADASKLRAALDKHLPATATPPAIATAPASTAPTATAPPAASAPAPPRASSGLAASRQAHRPRPPSSVRIFVSGSASGAGKSTISLALLGAALESGMYRADELAYIKPATQGVQQTLTAKFCAWHGIACRHVGPVVFFKGFTQARLASSAARLPSAGTMFGRGLASGRPRCCRRAGVPRRRHRLERPDAGRGAGGGGHNLGGQTPHNHRRGDASRIPSS